MGMFDTKLDQDKSDTNMKWKNDVLQYEKNLMLDVIIAFSKTFEGKNSSNISLREVNDFIDNFCEKKWGLNLRE